MMSRIFLAGMLAGMLQAPCQAQYINVIAPVGHKNGGKMAAFSHNGKLLVTGDDYGVLKWWDLETGKLLHTALQESDQLKVLNISPDDRWISCALDNGMVNIWSLNTGRLHMQVQAHSLYIQSADFSADSKYLATVSSNEDSAAIWDIEARKCVRKWSIGDVGIDIRFVEGSNLLVTSTTGNTGRLEIWDCQQFKSIARLPASYPLSLRDKYALQWSGDTLRIFDLTNGERYRQWVMPGANIKRAIFCDAQHLLYVSADARIHKMEMATGRELFSKPTVLKPNSNSPDISVNEMVANKQGTYCLLSDFESNGEIIDLIKGSTYKQLPKLGKYINYYNPVFDGSGNRLAVPGPESQAAMLWQLAEQKESQIGNSMVVTANQALLLANNNLLHYSDTLLAYFSVDQNKPLQQINIGWPQYNNVSALSPHDKFLLHWDESGSIRIYNLQEGTFLKEIKTEGGKLKQASLEGNGELLMAKQEQAIKVYRISDGATLYSMPIAKYNEDNASLSQDGKWLLWMDGAGWYKKIALANGRIADSVFIGKDRFGQYVWQSPDGSKVAIRWRSHGEAFSNLSMLDFASGRILWEIPDQYAWLERTRFNSDGSRLLVTTIKGNEVEIRETSTGKILGTVQLPMDQTGAADFLDEGKAFYVNALFAGTTHFYDSRTCSLLYSIKGMTNLQTVSQQRYLVASINDGGIMLIDSADFRQRASFYWLGGAGWFAVNADGLFDMAAGTAGKLHFVVNDSSNRLHPWSVLEFRQLKERYFQPGLLPIILGLRPESLRKVPPFDRAQLPPAVDLSITNHKLSIRVQDGGGGCGRLSLYIDHIETAPNLLDELSPIEQQGETSLYMLNLDKYQRFIAPDTLNEISVLAWNSSQWLSSRPVNAFYQPAEARGPSSRIQFKPKESRPSFYAVLMGTSDYAGDKLDLNFAAKDAQDFASAIGLAAEKLFGADRTHVKLLHTGAATDSLQPSRKRFGELMEEMAEQLKPEDVLLLYLSGHGMNIGGQDGDFYYLTKDAGGDDANALQDPAIRKMVAISSRELTEMLNRVAARKKLLILDACASGKAAEAIMLAMRDVPASQTRALDRMADRTGFYVLSGSAADAASYESSMFGQGLLTYALLKGMRGAALRVDGNEEYVDVARLMQYAVDEVPTLARNIGGIQQPLYRSPDAQKSYDLGRVDDAVKMAIKLATPKPMILAASFINSAENEDDLRIGEQLNGMLRELTARGSEADLLFTDAKSFPGAWKLSGSYRMNGNEITLDYRLRREDKKFDRTIRGHKNEIRKMLERMLQEIKQLAHP